MKIRGWQIATTWDGRGWQSRAIGGGDALPVEVDGKGAPPAVLGPLVGGLGGDPAEGDQLLARVLDASEVDVEESCDPGGLDAATGQEAPPAPRKAAEQDGEDGGNQRGSSAADEKSEHPSRDEEEALAAADGVVEGIVGTVCGWRFGVGESDGVFGPGEESGGDEAVDGGACALLGGAGESCEFGEAVGRRTVVVEGAAPGEDLVTGEPGAEIGDAEGAYPAPSPGVDGEWYR